MSMRITYLKDHDGHKAHKDYFVERTLACRLCENGVALPYVTYLEQIKKATAVALEKKKTDLVNKKEIPEVEMAISKKAKKREKAKVKTIDKNDKK